MVTDLSFLGWLFLDVLAAWGETVWVEQPHLVLSACHSLRFSALQWKLIKTLTLTLLLSESEMEVFTVSGALERTTSTLFFPSTPYLADITHSVSGSLLLAPGLAPLMTQYACLACTLCQEHMQAPKLPKVASLSALRAPVWPWKCCKKLTNTFSSKMVSVVWPRVQRHL